MIYLRVQRILRLWEKVICIRVHNPIGDSLLRPLGHIFLWSRSVVLNLSPCVLICLVSVCEECRLEFRSQLGRGDMIG